jgi:HK97 family phage portal protein
MKGIFSRIRPKAMTSDEISRLIIDTFGGGTTASGQSVNSTTAMQAMAVHSCVKIKADSIAQLPCHLYVEKGNTKDKAKDLRLYRLLHRQPNQWMTAPEFWGMCSACLDLRGNFFALKSGLPGREVQELIPIPMGRVKEVIQAPDYGLFYKISRPDGSSIDTIPGNRIMHIRGLVLDGFMGINPIQYARESIGLDQALVKHGAKLFSHGTMIGGVLQMPGAFKDRTMAQKFLDDFNDTYSSVENAHKTALLEQGVTWQKMAMTSVDSQFLEARNFQKKEIVDLFFGLPLSMLQSGDKVATYASADAFDLEYVKYALTPRLVNIEMAIFRDLLTEEQKENYFAKFSTGGLLRGDTAARTAYYQGMVNIEAMNPNEVRELEDMNPYPEGNEYRTRTSTVREKKGGDNKGGDEDES